jgi:hypothetical protein
VKRLILLFICTLFTYFTYAQGTCVTALALTPGVQQCGDSAGQPGDFDGGGGAPTNPCEGNWNDDEYWFTYTAGATGETVTLTLSAIGDQWAGLFVLDDCPAGTPTCIASGTNSESTADITFSTPALVAGTAYKIVITNYGTPNSTTFCLDAKVNPTICAMTALAAGSQAPCNPADNTYAQDVTVTFTDPPGTGMLDVNGQLFAIGVSPQTVTLTGLNSDGVDVDVTAAFTDDLLCTFTSLALFTAPVACQLGNNCIDALPLTVGTQQCGSSAGFPGDFPSSGVAPTNPCDAIYNDDEFWFSYTPEAPEVTLDLTMSAISDTWAGIFLLDDCPVNGPTCVGSATNTSSTGDLTFSAAVTMGTNYKIVITNYGAPNNTSFCLDAVELICVAPTVTMPVDPIDYTNCPATVDVSISIDDLGNSSMVTVSAEDDMMNPAGTGGVTGLGTFIITNVPLPQTSWSILIEHETDPSCNVTLGPFLLNVAPTVTMPVDPIDYTNCPATVDVSISIDDLGNSSMVTVSAEDDMMNPAGTGGVTGLGTFIITNVPVPQTSWSILIEHETDPSCNVTLGPFLLNCPPVNDAMCDAEALIVDAAQVPGGNAYSSFETNETPGSCWESSTTGNSVWYSFVSPGSGLVEVTTDFATGLTDSQASLNTVTDCNDLTTATEVGCSEDGGATGNGYMAVIETSAAPLTGGSTYYVQVDAYSSQVGDFEIQVNELAPANDECATAAVLANNTTGSLINQYFAAATNGGMGGEACQMGGSTPTPGDVWYSINTDADGGNLIVIVEPGPNSDIVMAVYDACGSPVPEGCQDLGGNGGVETINFLALFKDKKGNESSTRDADYFVRVYEKVASGEPFEIGAQGEALPIVLGSFEAKAESRGNRVEWTTLSEINSDYIEVQNSPNGSTKWESIGKVQTKGESLSKLNYELFDNNPYEVTYYRLNAVDKDGKAELSHSINVKREDKLGRMSLSPNPTSSSISLQTVSTTEMTGTIIIHDMTGKVMKNESVNLRNGLNTFSINLDDLNTGIYLFSLRTEEGIQVEKIVKQ